jgi:site-specific DNA-methyltransferase (adenine-specific)/modification methylase
MSSTRDYPDVYRPSPEVTLYRGDCLDILPTLTGVDAVITDPPYGIGVTRMTLGNRIGNTLYRGSGWDDIVPDLSAVLRIGVPSVVWGGNYFLLPISKRWLVWDKGTGDNDFADAEIAWTNCDGALRMFRRSWVGANAKESRDPDRAHPTQKPISLMAWCMDTVRVPSGALVLDPYMGSGTTGIACIRTGRRFIGIEIDPTHYATACRRIDDELQQIKLDI